jgi:hypothetical protein
VIASVIKLLEPVLLAATEIEVLRLDHLLFTFLLWLLLPPLAFHAIYQKKRPAWVVLISGGVVSSAVLIWF